MNKYQEFALKQTRYVIYEDSELKKPITGDSWIELSSAKIHVKQVEDYNVKKYFVRIDGATISSVLFDGKEYGIEDLENSSHPSVIVPIDFDHKVDKLTIKYSVVDDIEIEIEYEDADKDAFDAKVDKQNQAELAKKASIKISTGADLVNIYFKPCNDLVGKTTIDLYLANGKYSQPPMVMGKHDVWKPHLLGATPDQLLGKFEVENGMFFKSITGLANHAYGVKVSQFDKDGKLLFTTDFIYFDIR